jgi:hypothetical protein
VNKKLYFIIGLSIVTTFLTGVLFAYNRRLWDNASSIDAERFAQFGTFISAIFSVVTVVFIFLTFRQTRQTHEITVETLKEAKKSSVENAFLGLFQAHQNIVAHLHQRITRELKVDCSNLDAQNGEISGARDDKDFFELMYRILHLRYHGRNNEIDHSRIGAFFTDYDWVMGHYFRSIVYFIDWIDKQKQLDQDDKVFYIGFLKANLTNDELRLIFYYVISRDHILQRKLSSQFNKYFFFESVKDSLIYSSSDGDWSHYLTLVNP